MLTALLALYALSGNPTTHSDYMTQQKEAAALPLGIQDKVKLIGGMTIHLNRWDDRTIRMESEEPVITYTTTTKKCDTLWDLANQLSAFRLETATPEELAEQNNIDDPKKLPVGIKLRYIVPPDSKEYEMTKKPMRID